MMDNKKKPNSGDYLVDCHEEKEWVVVCSEEEVH